MNDKWLDSLKNRMEDYEESSPEGLWADIEASVLPKEKTRKSVLMPWVWRVSAAAAALAAGVFLTNIQVDRDPTPNTSSSSVNLVESPVPSEKPSLIAEAVVPDASSVPAASIGFPSLVTDVTNSVEDASEDIPDLIPEQKMAGISETITGGIPESQQIDIPEKFTEGHDGEDWSGYMAADGEGGRRKSSGLTAGVSLSGAASDGMSTAVLDSKLYYRGAAPSTNMYSNGNGNMNSGDGSLGNDMLATRAMEPAPMKTSSTVRTERKHERPVRMSLTLSYPLNRTIGVESGLTYSILRSTETIRSGSTVTEDVQTVRYLGIPLNMRASILGKDWMSLYVVGGGMVEKCVSGEVDPLQWSLNGAAGLQFNLGKRFGLYAEPGLSYRFDNGSGIETIYTKKPLDFTMSFGLRISLK